VRDITRPKQHEDYLVEFGTKKNALLDTLTHNISGALALMQNLSIEAEKYAEGSNPKKLRKYLALVSENSKTCLKIIEDFIQYEHEKSPDISVKNNRINIVEKIDFVRQELQHSHRSRALYLYSSVPHIHILTDEVKLLQVVNNLVSNAIKFSEHRHPVVINIVDHSNEVVVSVTDQGIGIPDTIKPFIFNNLTQAGRPGLQGEPSRGIGLSICKNLIEMIGGRIWFESEEGKGSIFYFSIPKIYA
jgi:two-component system sensor histidine kinase VicK